MQEIPSQSKSPSAAAVAAIASVIFVTAVTVAADLVPSLKTALAGAFTHHWIGKGILATGLFVVVYLLLLGVGKPADDQILAGQVKLLNIVSIVGAIVLVGFFLYEAFLK